MLVVAGSMQGTVASLTSLVSLGSVMVVGSSERSRSLVRRVSLSKRSFRGNRRWHYVSFSVCKYSVTTTDFVAEHGNAVSLDSNTYSGGKDTNGGADFVLKPAPKPVLKSSGSKAEPLVDMNPMAWDPSRISGNSDDEELGTEEERSKVIESLGEVLEKAEKLETSRSSEVGSKVDSISENKHSPSNSSTNSSNDKPVNSATNRKSKTLKSVWRKGDTVASVQKVVKESSKPINKIDKEEPNSWGRMKVESQAVSPLKPPQPPLRPQPKLQGKPSIAPPPVIKKPVILKDVGASPKSSVVHQTNSSSKNQERKPILIDKFASKKPVVDPVIAQAVLAPKKPGKGPPTGKFKDEYRKKNVSAGSRRRLVNDDDVGIHDEETSELNVSIPGAATARKGRKWSKASRKAARLQAAKEAAPVRVEILEVGEKGMSIEELAYNLTISEGEILGYLYSKGIKPDGVHTLDRDIVRMVCKEYDVEVIDADPIKMEEMARKKEILDEDDLDKLEGRPPVLTIMGHVDHGKVRGILSCSFWSIFGHPLFSSQTFCFSFE